MTSCVQLFDDQTPCLPRLLALQHVMMFDPEINQQLFLCFCPFFVGFSLSLTSRCLRFVCWNISCISLLRVVNTLNVTIPFFCLFIFAYNVFNFPHTLLNRLAALTSCVQLFDDQTPCLPRLLALQHVMMFDPEINQQLFLCFCPFFVGFSLSLTSRCLRFVCWNISCISLLRVVNTLNAIVLVLWHTSSSKLIPVVRVRVQV